MKGLPYTEKADVFSLGIVLWEIITRSLPYSEYEVSRSRFVAPFEDAIINGLRPTIPATCPGRYAKLIRSTWLDDPEARPTAQDVLNSLLVMQRSKLPPTPVIGARVNQQQK